METTLRQRIAGAIVLVTLGVIFIPALLDGSGYKSRQVQDIEIREKPEFPSLRNGRLKPVTTPLDNASQTDTVKPDTGKKPEKPLKSFALQVGTFSSNENAEKLRDDMRKAGYAAYVQKSRSKDKISYKVRIGPELEHSVLEKIKDDVKKSHKIDGYIVNHP